VTWNTNFYKSPVHRVILFLSYPCNRPWRPIGLWDVEAPTYYRQSVHRWRWDCQLYAPTTLYPQEDSWYPFLLEVESTPGPQCGWKDYVTWKFNELNKSRTCALPVCSIVIQPTTLLLVIFLLVIKTSVQTWCMNSFFLSILMIFYSFHFTPSFEHRNYEHF
jgi:hypothetical protein